MEKGDILIGNKTKHPIIFLKKENEEQFHGCIITHSSNKRYTNNEKLKPDHFCKQDKKGINYKIQFEDSFFVKLQLIKRDDLGPFEKAGKLTDSGIKFIETFLKDHESIFWSDYIKRIK